MNGSERTGWTSQLRERGVLRVAASYAVIAWLALQIADVTLEPLGAPKWVLTALIIAAAVGFPIAIALAWFLEIGAHGIERDDAADGVRRPSARGLRHYTDFIVIGVLLIAVVVLLVRQSDLGKPKPPENPAIAVLPFVNLSGDPEQEYFSDGLAEEMLDRLGRVPGLRVIARSSSFGFKDKDLDARTIAGKLGVTTLLEGSVRRDGQRLKLTARLIDGATGQQVWSGSFDRVLTDIFAVQAELASAIVNAIIPAAKGSLVESAAAPTTDLNAYDLYLAARGQLVLRTPESIRKAVELSEQAVRLDSNFARGQAQLAHALLFQALMDEQASHGQPSAALRRAEAVIHAALALDPQLSEAHGAYANLLRDSGRPGAEEQYLRAIELNPNNAAAWHDYSVYLSNTAGRFEESATATKRSLELDPRQPVTWANYLGAVAKEGRERFEVELARAIQTVGDMPGATDRFPFVAWAQDRDGYREALMRALHLHLERGMSPAVLMLPRAVLPGFPVALMHAGISAERRDARDDAPAWVYMYRAWQLLDPDRALRAVPNDPGVRQGVDLALGRLLFLVEQSGLGGDWSRLDRLFAELKARAGDEDPRVRSVIAFWLAVQGRYAEASASLAMAEPIPAHQTPPTLGSDRNWGQMDAARVRILRESGRTQEANRLAAEALDRLRPKQRSGGETCAWESWEASPVAYASLAANEGLKDEAVRALQRAMHCGDLPFGFWPQLPWFKTLEGYPPYDELLRERERRITRIRAEMIALEAGRAADPQATTGTAPGRGTSE